MIEQIDDINQIAREEGRRTAAEFLARKYDNPSHQLEYITSEARADYKFLLPITKDDIVLDICGGWGNTTTAFARICKYVYSVDASPSKLEFKKIRASQEELTNITFIQSPPPEIPLPQESCNIVLLSDTLECEYWRDTATGSRSNHSQILKAIWQRLVPGGCLYLGLDNRFSYEYFLGKRVPPSNLRFVTLLPASVANLYSRLFRGTETQNISYSLPGIKKTLKDVGFSDFDLLFPIPRYPTFRFLTDFQSREVTGFMISRLRLHSGFSNSFHTLAIFASFLGILPWVAPGFAVIAYKERS
jgi:2-polyprenyl-3-methyl-5-hydroxy-6-metoxy-1,4-benzoquinol methylase